MLPLHRKGRCDCACATEGSTGPKDVCCGPNALKPNLDRFRELMCECGLASASPVLAAICHEEPPCPQQRQTTCAVSPSACYRATKPRGSGLDAAADAATFKQRPDRPWKGMPILESSIFLHALLTRSHGSVQCQPTAHAAAICTLTLIPGICPNASCMSFLSFVSSWARLVSSTQRHSLTRGYCVKIDVGCSPLDRLTFANWSSKSQSPHITKHRFLWQWMPDKTRFVMRRSYIAARNDNGRKACWDWGSIGFRVAF